MPNESDVHVPDESSINNPMPAEFNIHSKQEKMALFKKKSDP
jgi:hypothetical protein